MHCVGRSRAAAAMVAVALIGAAAPAPAGEVAAAAERLRSVDAAALSYTYGVGSFTPEYTPPAAGSYALPVIDTVADHPLLGADGRPTTLFALLGDRVAVVAFIYTTCVEAAGCPLSMAVLHKIDRALAADPELGRRVCLLTISFDPERDTPQRLTEIRELVAPRATWRFATASSGAELEPLLADFGQPVAKLRFPDGQWSGLFRHVVKVFLVDGARRVRNVYSVGFLNPALVLNDVRTTLMESRGRPVVATPAVAASPSG
jgi:cytochrome c peroxidase